MSPYRFGITIASNAVDMNTQWKKSATSEGVREGRDRATGRAALTFGSVLTHPSRAGDSRAGPAMHAWVAVPQRDEWPATGWLAGCGPILVRVTAENSRPPTSSEVSTSYGWPPVAGPAPADDNEKIRMCCRTSPTTFWNLNPSASISFLIS